MLLNDTVVRVMECFLRNLDAPHHGSGIAKAKNMNQKTVSNTLNNLEREGFLNSKTVGKNKEFTLNLGDSEKAKRFLLALENARTIQFLDDNPKIREVVAKTTPPSKGISVIFGSYAKGIQRKGSDLDVFAVGDYDTQNIKRVSDLYGIKINVKNMSSEGFRAALREKDVFIREVVSDHLVVEGVEEYLNLVLSDYYGR